MELIQTPSFQLTIYADGNPKSDKLFLCLPWFLDAWNYAHLKGHRKYFAERGFFCVSFDPPGTFSSPWDISLYTVTNYLKAINEVIVYFGSRETIALGHSMGGTMALLASFLSKYISHTVSINSPGDMKTGLLASSRDIWKEQWVRTGIRDIPTGWIRNYSIPYVFMEDAIQYDMLDDLKSSRKPKLFVTGTRTSTDYTRVEEAYIYAWNPKNFVQVNCNEHSYRNFPEVIEEVNRVVEQFLWKYL